jgi:hypothetical protein
MKTESENLSPQQSIDLITSMIRQAQGNISHNSKYLLLWGWCITIANFGMYSLMKFTTYPHPYFVWLITIPAWIITMIYGMKSGKEAKMHTHLESITMWLWIGFGVAILPIIFFGNKINFQINSIILIMGALPTFVSGVLLRFKPLLFGGIIFLASGVLSFIADAPTQYLIGGVAVIFGYLLPGYMLKNREA